MTLPLKLVPVFDKLFTGFSYFLKGDNDGRGSGSWYRYDTKKAVEDSCSLPIGFFRNQIHNGNIGLINWSRNGNIECSINYSDNWHAIPIINLHYRYGGREDVRTTIHLQSTPLHFGGKRWWFTCPLTKNGLACKKRVGNVYCPPGSKYFGCRTCHDLTYRSCQEAHIRERMFGKLVGQEFWTSGFDRARISIFS